MAAAPETVIGDALKTICLTLEENKYDVESIIMNVINNHKKLTDDDKGSLIYVISKFHSALGGATISSTASSSPSSSSSSSSSKKPGNPVKPNRPPAEIKKTVSGAQERKDKKNRATVNAFETFLRPFSLAQKQLLCVVLHVATDEYRPVVCQQRLKKTTFSRKELNEKKNEILTNSIRITPRDERYASGVDVIASALIKAWQKNRQLVEKDAFDLLEEKKIAELKRPKTFVDLGELTGNDDLIVAGLIVRLITENKNNVYTAMRTKFILSQQLRTQFSNASDVKIEVKKKRKRYSPDDTPEESVRPPLTEQKGMTQNDYDMAVALRKGDYDMVVALQKGDYDMAVALQKGEDDTDTDNDDM